MYSINFSATGRKFCLSLHYNGENIYLFVNGTEMIKFKVKDSELDATLLCLGNISNDFSENEMKKTGLYGTVYEFSVDYGTISVDNTLNIYKYLRKKYIQYKMFKFIKQTFILAMMFFCHNLPGVNSLSCISMKNHECKIRPEIIKIKSNNPIFYSFSIKKNNIV